MNKAFKVVWSQTRNRFVVTDEQHRSHRPKKCVGAVVSAVAAAVLMAASPLARAAEEDSLWTEARTPIEFNSPLQAYAGSPVEHVASFGSIVAKNGFNSAVQVFEQASLTLRAAQDVLLRSEGELGNDSYVATAEVSNGGAASIESGHAIRVSSEHRYGESWALFVDGNLTLTSLGTTENSGIHLKTVTADRSSLITVGRGSARLVSHSDITMSAQDYEEGNQGSVTGLMVNRGAALEMQAAGLLSIALKNHGSTDSRKWDEQSALYLGNGSREPGTASLSASADRIEISAQGRDWNIGLTTYSGSQAQLLADSKLDIDVKGSGPGHQYGLLMYAGDNASTIRLSSDTISISAASDPSDAFDQSDRRNSFERDCAYALRTQTGAQTAGAPRLFIGTDGAQGKYTAELIELNATLDGVGNVGALRGEKVGEIRIGTADRSVVHVNVQGVNNKAGGNGMLIGDADSNGTQKYGSFIASGIYFGGGESTLDIRGKLLDINVDSGNIRARGFDIGRGGTLQVNAPMLMTVTGAFLPSDEKIRDSIGSRNDGLTIGLNKDETETKVTFNKPVTIIVTNDATSGDLSGSANAVFIEADSTVNFNSDTLLMAGNNSNAAIFQKIKQLRDGEKYDELAALAGGEWSADLIDGFTMSNSAGIRIGDGARVNFNQGTSTIVAKTMIQKRNKDHKGTGAVNVGSGAKLILTASDIGAGSVHVADGGALTTTTNDMRITGVASIYNSGIVMAENFTIENGGQVFQNDGLMTVNNLVVKGGADQSSAGKITVNGGTLSVAKTLSNADGTLSVNQGAEVILSSDALNLGNLNDLMTSNTSWGKPVGVGKIATSKDGMITVNLTDTNQKVSLNYGQYKKLKDKIFGQLFTADSKGSIRFGNYSLTDFTYDNLKEAIHNWDPNNNPDEFSNQTLREVDGSLKGSWQGVELKGNKKSLEMEGDLKLSGNGNVVKAGNELGGVNTKGHTFTATGNAKLAHVTNGGAGGAFEVAGHATVSNVQIGNLTVAENASLTVDTLNVGVAVIDGDSKVGHLASGYLFADPAFNEDGTLAFSQASRNSVGTVAAGTTVEAGQGALIAVGPGVTADDAEAALRRLGFTQFSSSGLRAAAYVSTNATYQGTLLVTGRTNAAMASDAGFSGRAGSNQVYVAANTGLFVDTARIDRSTAVFSGDMTFQSGSVLGLINVADDCSVTLTDGTIDNQGATLYSDNSFVTLTLTENGISSTLSARVDDKRLAQTVSSMGLHSIARRADGYMASLVADRAADFGEEHAGLNLWVDAAGERYHSNGFADVSRFKADLAYAAFGGDVHLGGRSLVGMALGQTTGSLRATGLKNSVDGWQLSAYGATDLTEGLRLTGEVTYSRTDNDVTGKGRRELDNKIDASVLSAGLALQTSVQAVGLTWTPSVGLRLSRIESDAFKVGRLAVDKGELNLLELPMSLRVTGQAVQLGDWGLAPTAKLTFTPTFGDDSVKVRHVDQRVLDMTPLEADFGLTAVRGNLTLGASLKAGVGQHDTTAFGANLRLNYAF